MNGLNIDTFRHLLLGIFLIGCLGTTAELLLLEHFEEWQQWLPLALLGLGVLIGAMLAWRPARRPLHALRALAIMFVLSGMLGVYFHYQANLEFEVERDPSRAGLELAGDALTGALPSLAPGSMILLGLIGLLITAGHPALQGAVDEQA